MDYSNDQNISRLPSAEEMRDTAIFLCGVASGIGFYSPPLALLLMFPLAGLIYLLSYKC